MLRLIRAAFLLCVILCASRLASAQSNSKIALQFYERVGGHACTYDEANEFRDDTGAHSLSWSLAAPGGPGSLISFGSAAPIDDYSTKVSWTHQGNYAWLVGLEDYYCHHGFSAYGLITFLFDAPSPYTRFLMYGTNTIRFEGYYNWNDASYPQSFWEQGRPVIGGGYGYGATNYPIWSESPVHSSYFFGVHSHIDQVDQTIGFLVGYSSMFSKMDATVVLARAGAPHKRRPGMCGDDPCQCVGNSRADLPNFGESPLVNCTLNKFSGNLHCVFGDPITTRGYPLINNIHVDSQVVENARPMANATFSYDIHVVKETVYNSGTGVMSYVVVDGDGKRHEFGPTSSAPAAGHGVFSQLTESGGYQLTNAGPPEEINKAGNFSYTFDSAGKLTSLTDPNGNVQSLTYTGGKLTKVLDETSQRSIDFTYTGNFITQVTDNGSGAVTTLAYTTIYFDNAPYHRLSSVSLAKGGSTAYSFSLEYMTVGILAKVTRDGDSTSAIKLNYTWFPSYDGTTFVPYANVSTIQGDTELLWTEDSTVSGAKIKLLETNPQAGATQYDFAENRDLKQLKVPAHAGGAITTYSFTYDSKGNVTQVTDGTRTQGMTYASNGLLSSHTDGEGRTTSYTYNGANLTSISDEIGTRLELFYTDSNYPNVPTQIRDADLNTWNYTLNAKGQVAKITPPTGSPTGPTTITYHEKSQSPSFGYPASIENGANDIVTFDSYSLLGEPLSVSTYANRNNPQSRSTTKYSYDAGRRVTEVKHPDGKTFQTVYKGRNPWKTIDEAGTQYETTYHSCCDLPTQMNGPMSLVLKWERDRETNLTKFTDARNKDSTYAYGEASELVSTDYPDGSGFEYEYDNLGRLAKVTNSRSQEKEYSYDLADNLTAISFPTTSSPAHEFTYYDDNSIHTVEDGTGTTTYEYFDNRWLKSVTYNLSASGLTNVQKVEYTYNPDGTRATMTWKDGTTTVASWSYGYDAAGRLTSVTRGTETTTFTYDGEGKVLTQTNANGTVTNYTYNEARDWVTEIKHSYDCEPFLKYNLTYDGGNNTVGNITGVTELDSSTVTYGYDALYRLTSEIRTGTNAYTKSYTYDLAGNLLTLDGSTFASYDDANKFSSVAGGSASYDADGNLTAISGTTIPSGSFAWNENDKLTSQTAGSVTTSYGYNASGKRVWSQVGSAAKTYFVFDGDRLIGEVSGSTPAVAYTWANGRLVGEGILSSSATLHYHFGPQGETRALTNSSGSVTDSYTYTGYGKDVTTTGSTTNPFRYGGGVGYYTDGPSGLMLAGARWYHSALSRWLNRDPKEYFGGSSMYEYVMGNPIFFGDPSGLDPRDPFWQMPPFGSTEKLGPVAQTAEEAKKGTRDLWKNYEDMNKAWTKGADRYFHCKGHCEASRRGLGGLAASQTIGLGREILNLADYEPRRMSLPGLLEDCEEDMAANEVGRRADRTKSCTEGCQSLRPPILDPKY